MSNLGSSTFYERPKGETTEWEDILRDKGIIPPKEEDKLKVLEKVVEEAEEAKAAAYDPLAHKSLEELKELEEDDSEYADSRILEQYRAARVAELKAAAARNKFGGVRHISRDDFTVEVNDASKEAWVVVLLYKDGVPNSKYLEAFIPRLAAAHKATKFVRIVADQCIAGFKDEHVPALLVYHDGELQARIFGLDEFGGARATQECVEWVLAKKGALTTELEDDPRKTLRTSGLVGGAGTRRIAYGSDDDDDE